MSTPDTPPEDAEKKSNLRPAATHATKIQKTNKTPHTRNSTRIALGQKKSPSSAQVYAIYEYLEIMYPDARCELNFQSPFQLLVATVLSAQTTDIRVNSVTGALFSLYGTPQLLAHASLAKVEEIIKPIGFYRVKAKNIIGLSQQLLDNYHGQVPADIDQLISLKGVGRKTANVVLGNEFGIPGLTIDTHCGRLARRFEWTTQHDPIKVEQDLARIIPEKLWTQLCHLMIFQGRRICHSRTPACGSCYLASLCPSYGIGVVEPARSQALVKGPERAHLLALVGQQQYCSDHEK